MCKNLQCHIHAVFVYMYLGVILSFSVQADREAKEPRGAVTGSDKVCLVIS